MKPSPSFKATLKRFAWLWGALLGAALLPVLMEASFYAVNNCLPALVIPGTTILVGPPSPSLFWLYLSSTLSEFSVWSGGLGGCGGMLCVGYRSLTWRLLSIAFGAGTASYQLWDLWDYCSLHGTGSDIENQACYLYAATRAPLLLAALLLVFFALFLRPSSTSATKA